MINFVQSSSGSSAASQPVSDVSDNAQVEQILSEIRQEQEAIQSALAQATPGMQQMLAQMDPGLIGYA